MLGWSGRPSKGKKAKIATSRQTENLAGATTGRRRLQTPVMLERVAPAVAAPLARLATLHLFLDCDDCLYQNDWRTANKISDSIAAYTASLGVSKERAYALYKTHGTCLRGLLAEGLIPAEGSEAYLHAVHQINYSDVAPDPQLASMLGRLAVPTWVFTASTREHAERCIARVGLDALPFCGIIDCRSCNLETKHSRSSFEVFSESVSEPHIQPRF